MGLLTAARDAATSFKDAFLNMRTFRPADSGIVQYFGGVAESYAGKAVTVPGALQLSTVWACVTLLSESIGTMPLEVFSKDEGGFATLDPQNPLWDLLHTQPNYDMTASEWMRALVMQLLLHGNGYCEIIRTTRRVVALNLLRTEAVTLRRDASGALVYLYRDAPAAGPREIAQGDILHIKGTSLDGITGMSPISFARHTLGLAMAGDEASGRTLSNGMRISGYMKSPQLLQPAQRAQAEVMLDRFKGSQNTGKVPLLEGGWEFVPNTLPPADAQLIEQRSFSVEEIARWYRVPPHMVGHSNVTTWGSGIEQQTLGFLTYVLNPYLVNIEAALTKALVPPGARASTKIAFHRDGLLSLDSVAKATLFGSLANNGLRTRNELRRLDGLPPMDSPLADVLTVQSALVPIDRLGEARPSAPNPVHNPTNDPLAPADPAPGKTPALGLVA